MRDTATRLAKQAESHGGTHDERERTWTEHFGSAGKLVSVSGWAKHGVLYEFTSLADRAKYFRAHEARNKKNAAWTHAVVTKLVHAPGSPAVARRIWPPVNSRR